MSIGNFISQLRENPYLGEYIKEGLLNKIPFINRDAQEERAYVGARGYGIGDMMGRPEYPDIMQSMYDEGMVPQEIIDNALGGANFRMYPETGYPTEPTSSGYGEVAGAVQPEASVPDFGAFASDWYTSVGHPEQADKAALIASKAYEYGLDPYMALALSAQEGGWARYYPKDSPNNYFGWGVTDSGDMGFAGDTLEGWLDTYLPQIAKQYGGRNKITDWGGSLSGYGSGSPYTARYNYNDSWVEALSSLINQANRFREQNYPDLPATSIDTRY